MISNTSNISSSTTIYTEQLSPHQILDPQENGIVRFQLHEVPMAADVKGAYHWRNTPSCTQARIFHQVSQSFGDTSAAVGLEIPLLFLNSY